MELGERIPDFELPDQYGKPFHSKEFLGEPLIAFFYPKDFTPGCTSQACGFRDSMDVFLENSIRVVGISSDSVSSHANFASRYSLEYPILADVNGKVRNLFGVKNTFLGLLPGRETFVFDKEGKLVLKYRSMNPKSHLSTVLSYFKIDS